MKNASQSSFTVPRKNGGFGGGKNKKKERHPEKGFGTGLHCDLEKGLGKDKASRPSTEREFKQHFSCRSGSRSKWQLSKKG